jgi:hypothetical protein
MIIPNILWKNKIQTTNQLVKKSLSFKARKCADKYKECVQDNAFATVSAKRWGGRGMAPLPKRKQNDVFCCWHCSLSLFAVSS